MLEDQALREGVGCWALRGVHSNMASYVFILLYAHVGRAWYYGVAIHVSMPLYLVGYRPVQ